MSRIIDNKLITERSMGDTDLESTRIAKMLRFQIVEENEEWYHYCRLLACITLEETKGLRPEDVKGQSWIGYIGSWFTFGNY